MIRSRCHTVLIGCVAIATLCTAFASTASNLDALSLEELTSLEVATETRDADAMNVAGAKFVLTQDDIRRSGATSIPQALRLVPGLQVAQVDGSRWAISARGFNSRMSNRILVLIDGRSLYTPLTGGVFWNTQDTMVEEIDRIEVLRGAGGATWGTNAFNAVINIVTKRASQTGGLVVSSELASDSSKMGAVRVGDAEGDFKWRAFGKYSDGGANRNEQGESVNDDWEQARIGGRGELLFGEGNRLQLNFEAYSNESSATIYDTTELVREMSVPWPSTRFVDIEEHSDGGFAGARFMRELANGGRLNADASMQYYSVDSVLMDAHGTNGELNVQHLASTMGRHQLTSGFMVRGAHDAVGQGAWRLSRPDVSSWRASAFAQNEIAFLDRQLTLTGGAKLEYSDITGADFLPSLRALYVFDNGASVWGAASRGVRAPALTEHYGRLGGGPRLAPFTAANPTPLPVRGEVWGDEDMDMEKVTSYEFGVRHRLSPLLSFDLALYYNVYEGLRGPGAPLPVLCQPSGTPVAENPLCLLRSTELLAPFQMTNVYDTTAWGGELIATYQPISSWKLIGSYARVGHRRQDVDLQLAGGAAGTSTIGAMDSTNQFSLRSSLTLHRNWDLDAQLRYVDELQLGEVPSYWEMNLRAAWRPTQHFELAVRGSNLLHDRHQEFSSDFGEIVPVWIERNIALQARWFY